MNYRCARCKERIVGGMDNMGVQCPVCGHKIFYKERKPTRKAIPHGGQ